MQKGNGNYITFITFTFRCVHKSIFLEKTNSIYDFYKFYFNAINKNIGTLKC